MGDTTKYQGAYENPAYLTQLFEGNSGFGVSVAHVLFGDTPLPIFREPSAGTVTEAYNGKHVPGVVRFQPMCLPDTNKHLDGVKVGTIRCITADAKWFGIEAGKEIIVHVISVECNLQIFFADFYRYNELVQDIVNCIMCPKNETLLANTVLPLFLHT